jgi:hypothetical protein
MLNNKYELYNVLCHQNTTVLKSNTWSITLLTTCFGLYILAILRFFLNLLSYYTNSMVCFGGGGRDLVYNIGWHESEYLGWSFLYLLQSFVVARLGTLFVCCLSQVTFSVCL